MSDRFSLKHLASVILSALLLFLGLPGGGDIWPVLFIALVPAFSLTLLSTWKGRLFGGILAGFLYHACQIYWITLVLGRYGGLPLPLAVIGYCLLALYLGLYSGVFYLIVGWLRPRMSPCVFIWFMACLWVGIDWLRSFLFSGLPWLDLGYGFWQVPSFLQLADITGHHGLTFLAVAVNGLLFTFFLPPVGRRGRMANTLIVILLCTVTLVYGQMRMRTLQGEIAAAPKAVIGVVQGNREQMEKWVPQLQKKTVDIYLQQSLLLKKRSPAPELVVWPETALPFYPMRSPYFSTIADFARLHDTALLTGAPWFEVVDAEKEQVKFFNSALLLTRKGILAGLYYKTHLVPFGEYVPLKNYLPFLSPLVENVGDFTAGNVERPLVSGQIRAGVLICFESIFPDIARKWANAGANVLVNLTNDAWYGRSSAPHQSLAMSVFRAVETRRSLVRAANTGISGFVDPLGRVLQRSDLFVVWAGASEVSLQTGKTFYVRGGYLFALCCLLLALIMVTCCLISRNSGKTSISPSL